MARNPTEFRSGLFIGRSPSAACAMRTRFAKIASGHMDAPRSKRELQSRAHARLEQEARVF